MTSYNGKYLYARCKKVEAVARQMADDLKTFGDRHDVYPKSLAAYDALEGK